MNNKLDNLDDTDTGARDTLHELQRTFTEIIRRPLLQDDSMQQDERTEGIISAGQILNPHERMELYAKQYWWRLLGSLADDFKSLKKYLGPVKFRSVIEDYLSKHPSKSYTLRHLGQYFVSYLQANYLHHKLHPIVLDIALLEWSQIQVFYAATGQVLDVNALQISPDKLFLRLRPTVKIHAISYPAHQLIIEFRANNNSRLEVSNNLNLNETDSGALDAAPTTVVTPAPLQSYLAVHRFKNGVYIKELTKMQYTILERLNSGASLEDTLSFTANKELDQDNFDPVVTFQEFAKLGWLQVYDQ